jgi:hypothetical protein
VYCFPLGCPLRAAGPSRRRGSRILAVNAAQVSPLRDCAVRQRSGRAQAVSFTDGLRTF